MNCTAYFRLKLSFARDMIQKDKKLSVGDQALANTFSTTKLI